MDKKQFSYLMTALSSNYRTFELNQDQMRFWYEQLKDIPYQQLHLAVTKHIATEEWQPTIAHLRKSALEVVQPNMLDSNSAWGEVQIAIRNYGSYNEESALDSMSPITAQVVKNMNYKELCLSENHMADRAHFMKMYDTYLNREKKQMMLSEGTKQGINQLTNELVKALSMPK